MKDCLYAYIKLKSVYAVTTIMKNAGYAHMGVGAAKGSDKAQLASMAAISSPLLETSIAGAMGVLVCITASQDIQLEEVNLASQMIYEEAHPDATIIWGATLDPTLEDEMRVTIIATGFSEPINKITSKTKPVEEAPVQETVIPEAQQNNITTVIEEVVNEASSVEEKYVQEPIQKPETIVNTIPSRNNAQNTYKDYQDIFKSIRNRSKE